MTRRPDSRSPRGRRLPVLLALLALALGAAGWLWVTRDPSPNELRQLPTPLLRARANGGAGNVEALCTLGDRLLDEADVEGAAAAFRRARDLDPVSARALSGWILSATGRTHPGWAEKTLRELAAAQPDRYEPRLALARVYMINGELDLPGDLLKEAVRLGGRDAEPVYHYGVWSGVIGATGRGIENLEEACRRAPRVPAYQVAAADLLIHLARYPEAEAHLKAALAVAPDLSSAQYQYGRLLLSGRRTRAEQAAGVEHLEKAVSAAPGWDLPLLTLGRHLTQHGDVERGVELLEQARDFGPPARQLLAALAQGYYRLGRRADGDRLTRQYNQALAAERQGQQAQQALRQRPKDVPIRLRKARQMRQQHRDLQALLVYREILHIEPDNREALEATHALAKGP